MFSTPLSLFSRQHGASACLPSVCVSNKVPCNKGMLRGKQCADDHRVSVYNRGTELPSLRSFCSMVCVLRTNLITSMWFYHWLVVRERYKVIGGSGTLVSSWWLVKSILGPKKLVGPEKWIGGSGIFVRTSSKGDTTDILSGFRYRWISTSGFWRMDARNRDGYMFLVLLEL